MRSRSRTYWWVLLGRSKATLAASAVCLLGGLLLADGDLRAVAWLVLALALPMIRRLPLPLLLAALFLLYLRYSGHGDSFYPGLEWIRVRGMDLWPGLLQCMGLVLVYAAGAAVLSGKRRLPLIVLLLGTVMSAGWWVFPGHFNIDVLDMKSSSSVPVVIDGQIEYRQWHREVLPAAAVDAWPRVIGGERTLSGLGHGMGQKSFETHGMLRATLWGVQEPVMVAYLMLTAASSAVGLLVVLLAALGGPLRALGWWSLRLLGLTLWLPPVMNVILRLVGAVGGLPEASSELHLAILQAGVTLVVIHSAREVATRWSD